MQCSTVLFSDINLGNRIDAEYFQPTYLHIEQKLLNGGAMPLRNYCQITGSAFYPAATHLYEIGDLPFMRCVDCISYPVITGRQDQLFEKIPKKFAEEHKNIKRLKKGEIVITKVGSPCYASIINDLDDVALSRTVLGLKSINNINPYYLVAFLRSKYGFLQLVRERELTIQFQLTLERVGNILVFRPKNRQLEILVSKCLLLYEEINRKSELLYSQAKTLLLSELGLMDWQPKHQLTFIKNYSDTEQIGRIDSEYYQPKYNDLINALKTYKGGWDTLGAIVSIKKCIEVGSEEYLNEGIPFVRVSNLSSFEVTEEKYISEQLYDKVKQHQPQKGEILFSKDASPGIAYYLNKQPPKMIPSGGILRLKNKTKNINNEYLTLVLNSIVVKEQVNRDIGGSVILHWRPDQIKETVIPILPKEIQEQIKQMIIEAFSLREKSKYLMECAKRTVEVAIEQNEKIAIEWLNKQIKEGK